MRIAILGATSQIAKDLVLSFSAFNDHELILFARRPELVNEWLKLVKLQDRYVVDGYENLNNHQSFDVLINFVGVGDPSKAVEIGASIFDLTFQFDTLALDYLHQHSNCRYLFLSSGAAYGSDFKFPADENTLAQIPINGIKPQDWYGVAKLHAEARHRALEKLAIVDIRVFNYFSHTQNMSAKFLITDIARSISKKTTFATSSDRLMRDFLHPKDFYRLIESILIAPKLNCAIDCYSLAPVEKLTLLSTLQDRFGLRYQILERELGVNATGKKPFYYSLNKKAAQLGYEPQYSSVDGICMEMNLYLQGPGST